MFWYKILARIITTRMVVSLALSGSLQSGRCRVFRSWEQDVGGGGDHGEILFCQADKRSRRASSSIHNPVLF